MMNLQMIKRALITYVTNSGKAIWSTVAHPLSIVGNKKCKVRDYRIYGNTFCGILPQEYRQVEYIEATGGQYLEIDYIASSITTTKGSFQLTNVDEGRSLFGSRESNKSGGLSYALNWGGELPYKYYNSFNRSASSSLTDKEIDLDKHTFEKAKNKLYIDGELIHTVTNTIFTTPYNMIVFGCNSNGQVGYLSKAKIFNIQFYDDDILMVDLIPCYRKLDEIIGMYDLVTGNFYTNQGTGVFLRGEEIYPTFDNPIEINNVGKFTTKNLLNLNSVYTDYVNDEGGITYTNDDFGNVISKNMYEEWKENTQYTFSANYELTNSDNNRVCLLVDYTDGTSKSYWNVLGGQFTGDKEGFGFSTTEAGKTVKLMRLSYATGNRTMNVKLTNMQLEEGAEATESEPYHKYKIPIKVSCNGEEKIVNIYLDNPLMSMLYNERKYADYIDSEKGVVVGCCLQEVYDGTEDWEKSSTTSRFFKRITTARTVLCSHYKTAGEFGTDKTVVANYSEKIYIEDSRFSTVEEFKAYLVQQSEAGTPVTAVFLKMDAYNGNLEETSVDLPRLPQFKGTTVYEGLTDTPPSGIEVQYYG